jgi:tetratricopeptide (TPR) repeat protein
MEQNNFYAKAIEYLEKSILINKNNFLVHYNLSKLFANLGRIDEALQYIKTACGLNKGDVNSLVLCSLLYSAKDEN